MTDAGKNNATLPGALVALVSQILRPLAGILLRHGMSCVEFEEISRWVFVNVALREAEFALPGRPRQFKSRAAILTGLSRKEVMRLAAQREPAEIPSHNRAARVLAAWQSVRPFVDNRGMPRTLPIRGSRGEASFTLLVRRFSGDVPYRAVLDELLRAGVVEKVGDAQVRIAAPAPLYPPIAPQALASAAASVVGLLATLRHNLHPACTEPFPQQLVFDAQLAASALPELRAAVRRELDAFAARLQALPELRNAGGGTANRLGRAALGLYYFES